MEMAAFARQYVISEVLVIVKCFAIRISTVATSSVHSDLITVTHYCTTTIFQILS